jgi:DNA-binding HxlR family transcriptional regulator
MKIDECPVKTAIDVIGGKWKPLILYALKKDALRFGELRRQVPGSTHKVLIEQLRQLEADGIVERTLVVGSPPGAEYRLSPYGETLHPVLEALAHWGMKHRVNAEAATSTTSRASKQSGNA